MRSVTSVVRLVGALLLLPPPGRPFTTPGVRRWVGPRTAFPLGGAVGEAADDALTALVQPADSYYTGPVPPGGELQGVQASIDVADYGLTFTVAQSVVAPGELGVFVQLMDNVRNVTVPAGTPLGAVGTVAAMRAAPATDDDRTVRFALDGSAEEHSIMFEGQVCRLQDVLAPGNKFGLTALPGLTLDDGQTRVARHLLRLIREFSVTAVDGHELTPVAPRSGAGEQRKFHVQPVDADPAGQGSFFTPDRVEPSTVDLRTVGQFVNDLAIDLALDAGVPASRDEYERDSKQSNILVLQWNLEEAKGQPGRLVPKLPVPCVCFFDETVSFANAGPMEIGCRYGHSYWRERTAGALPDGTSTDEVSID